MKNCQIAQMTEDSYECDRLLQAISQIVRTKRLLMGMTQEELAQRAGLHRTYISDIEQGAQNLSLRSMSKLASALDLSPLRIIELADRLTVKESAVADNAG